MPFEVPTGFDSLCDFARELIEHQTWMVLDAMYGDSHHVIRLLRLVIQGKDRTLTEHAHFPLGFEDGIEWYERNDVKKDITVDVVVDFLDRSLVEVDETYTDLPTFPYRVGFTWGWLFALIVSGNVLHTQEVVVSTLATAPSMVVVGPLVHNDGLRERSTPNATHQTPNKQRQLAVPRRKATNTREEV